MSRIATTLCKYNELMCAFARELRLFLLALRIGFKAARKNTNELLNHRYVSLTDVDPFLFLSFPIFDLILSDVHHKSYVSDDVYILFRPVL